MALLDVHPDYVSFDGNLRNGTEYSFALYEELLQHISRTFEKQYWQAQPSEVAAFVRDQAAPQPEPTPAGLPTFSPSPPVKKELAGRSLMFVENYYPQDTRVRNEADLLTEAGCKVVVVALRKKNQTTSEVINGVQVYRIPRFELFQKTPKKNPTWAENVMLKATSFVGYIWEYAYFTTACYVMSIYVAARHGFDVIHAHNPPDTLFLVALPYKLFGKKFIFDHHDLCPELYRSRYGAKEDDFSRMLQMVEWCSLKLADVTIATNESYKEAHISRAGKDPKTIFVVRNGPNAQRMAVLPPSARLRKMGKCILCYIGSLNPQDGVDYLLRSLGLLIHKLQRRDFYCVIMGSGDSLEDLRVQAKELQLDGYVELAGFVSDEELQANLSAADVCVDPDPSSPLNDVSTWIKIMEYMAYGKPIVSFDLKESQFSAQDAALFVPANDELAFAKAVAQLMDDPHLRKKMGEFGRERVEEQLQWSVVGKNLVRAYQSL